METGDRVIEYTMLAAYLALLLWVGVRSARRVRSSDDYTLAGRDVPWIVVLATTAATMLGGGASVGMVSELGRIGIAAAFVTCGWHLQLIFTGMFVAPRLRGLNLITVGDYIHDKFGPLARELAVVNSVVFLVGALAAQMAAIGTMTNIILGVPYGTALLIGAAVTIFYSTIGGIRAVVSTDVIQFVILIVGFGIASALLMSRQGGFAVMEAAAHEGQFHLTGHLTTLELISLFVAFLLGEAFVPPYVVRCLIAKNQHHAKWGVSGAGIFLLLFLPIATVILGTAAQINPEVRTAIENEKQALLTDAAENQRTLTEEDALKQASQVTFPTLVRVTFHPIFSGIMIAAIIAAVMSSADSCRVVSGNGCDGRYFSEDTCNRKQQIDSCCRWLRPALWSSVSLELSAPGSSATWRKSLCSYMTFGPPQWSCRLWWRCSGTANLAPMQWWRPCLPAPLLQSSGDSDWVPQWISGRHCLVLLLP